MKSFNQENHGSDSFFIANLLLGIAFSLQKHCYFYCSFIGKVLIINMIITMKGEGASFDKASAAYVPTKN